MKHCITRYFINLLYFLFFILIIQFTNAQIKGWIKLSLSTHPEAREGMMMTYDEVKNKVLLFGGSSQSTIFDDTWEWDGENWTQLYPSRHPSARMGYAMTYADSGKILLFGGDSSDVLLNDTWEWDGENWTQLFPSQSPSPRKFTSMAINKSNHKIILFGGEATDEIKGDTWEWNGTNWTERFPGNHPNNRSGHTMAYYSISNDLRLIGGDASGVYFYDSWVWVSDVWQNSAPFPYALTHHTMVAYEGNTYEPLRSFIVWGRTYGTQISNSTWSFTGGWTSLNVISSPEPRLNAAMAINPNHNGLIIFGGRSALPLSESFYYDTWELTQQPRIFSIKDVPYDQGGRVQIRWYSSIIESLYPEPTQYYSIWRAIPDGISMTGRKVELKDITHNFNEKAYMITKVNGKNYAWEWLSNQPANWFPEYSYTASTLYDSMSSINGMHYFLISARAATASYSFISNIDSGYSVDNFYPSAVTGLSAIVQAGQKVLLYWNPDTIDPDVRHYDVYRSLTAGFIPNPSMKIGTTIGCNLIDNSPIQGEVNYYRVVTVDIHGNESVPSSEVSVRINNITSILNAKLGWNIISLPLSVADALKIHLFPTSISDAYYFSSGGYQTADTLKNGVGYWLKYNGDENITIEGTLRDKDTIEVVNGWNMVGSLNTPIPVSTIESVPLGIITGDFFGYQGSYFSTDTLKPFMGYWVKVNQDGQLILSSPLK